MSAVARLLESFLEAKRHMGCVGIISAEKDPKNVLRKTVVEGFGDLATFMMWPRGGWLMGIIETGNLYGTCPATCLYVVRR